MKTHFNLFIFFLAEIELLILTRSYVECERKKNISNAWELKCSIVMRVIMLKYEDERDGKHHE